MGNDDFNLSIGPQIDDLANDVLDKKELAEIDLLNKKLMSKKTWGEAITRLREVVKDGPKRPVYYIGMYMQDLPENTRSVVFFAGSYVDCLMKHVSNEKGKNIVRALFTSLKNNIKWSKEVLGIELVDILNRYETFVYTPAKHDYEERAGRPHLFSSKEAITVCFITMKLAKQLIYLSDEARDYSLNKLY